MGRPRPVVAVLPVKPLGRALGRLAGVLGARERSELQQAMLLDVLGACAAADGLAGVVVVTSDPVAGGLARVTAGARVVPDHQPARGMNPAVARGLDAATADGQAALVLTSDLPLVRPADLEWVLERRPAGEGATLVASRDGTGTNAMLLDPAWSLVPQLGVGSLARHLSQAARRHVDVHVHAHPRIGLDVDTPDDLAALWATGADCAARDVCARLEVGERLAAAGALG